MRKTTKVLCLLVSMIVLLQTFPANAQMVPESIRTVCNRENVITWIKNEVGNDTLLINPFRSGFGVSGSTAINLFQTEIVELLKDEVNFYSPNSSGEAEYYLDGKISIVRGVKGLVTRLELTLESVSGAEDVKECTFDDEAVTAFVSNVNYVKSENDENIVPYRKRSDKPVQAGITSAINKKTLPGSEYEIAVINGKGEKKKINCTDFKNTKDLLVERRFSCVFDEGEEFQLAVKNCRPKGASDVVVEVFIDGISIFHLWEDKKIGRPGYIQLASDDEFVIKGWMRWLQQDGTQENNTLAFRAGKYSDSIRLKYGIPEIETTGGGIGTISFIFREVYKPGSTLADNDPEFGIGQGSETTTECHMVESSPVKDTHQIVTITYSVNSMD